MVEVNHVLKLEKDKYLKSWNDTFVVFQNTVLKKRILPIILCSFIKIGYFEVARMQPGTAISLTRS